MLFDRARVAAALPAYELGDELGSGAFGVVVRARHRRLNRPVAVKVVHVADDEARQRFVAEAQLLAAIDHPHVVRVYDYVEADPLCLIVMELLDGGTLTRRRKAISATGTCAVGLAVAAALGSAHSHNVLHRDIKPDNVLFDGTELIKTTDFGIAKVFAGDETTASMVAGTPRYMAPEQIVQGQLGPGTDLYALGVVLYELLANRPMFDPRLPLFELYQRTLRTPPDPLDTVPSPVAAVVMRALAKNRDDRQPSTHAFALELAHAATLAFGPGWTARSGIRLKLDDDVKAVTEGWGSTARDRRTSAPEGQRSTAPTWVGEQARKQRPPGRVREPAPRLRVDDAPVALPPRFDLPAKPRITAKPRIPADHRSEPDVPHGDRVTAVAEPQNVPARPRGVSSKVTVSADSRLAAARNATGTVFVWDVAGSQPRELATFVPHDGGLHSFTFLGELRVLATAHRRSIRFWQLRDNAKVDLVGEVASEAQVLLLAWMRPDRRNPSQRPMQDLVVVDSQPAVTAWHIDDSGELQQQRTVYRSGLSLPVTVGPQGRPVATVAAALSRSGWWLATADQDGVVEVYTFDGSATRLSDVHELPGHSAVVDLSFTSDERALAVTDTSGSVSFWEPLTAGRPRRRQPKPLRSDISSAQFGPLNRQLATASSRVGETGGHAITVWRADDLGRPRQVDVWERPGAASTVFTADGKQLVVAGADGRLSLWPVAGRF